MASDHRMGWSSGGSGRNVKLRTVLLHRSLIPGSWQSQRYAAPPSESTDMITLESLAILALLLLSTAIVVVVPSLYIVGAISNRRAAELQSTSRRGLEPR